MYIVRVYYNRSSDYPFVWSCDHGDISTEKIYKDIKITMCKVYSRFSIDKDNINEPRAWFEVECNKISVKDDVLYLS